MASRTVKLSGKSFEILLSLALITIPTIALSLALVAIVYTFKISNSISSQDLTIPGYIAESNVYYLTISIRFFLTIASWSSTAAPYLVGFALTLGSYPIARSFMTSCGARDLRALPTPYQFSLALDLMGGKGFGAIWRWLRYRLRRKTRAVQNPILSGALGFFILATILSWLIVAFDSWLHLSTQSIIFTQITNIGPGSLNEYRFSHVLNTSCLISNNSYQAQQAQTRPACTIEIYETGGTYANADTAIEVLSNFSSVSTMQTYPLNSTTSLVYLDNTPSAILEPLDYRASTYGVATTCEPVTQACGMYQKSGASVPYDCKQFGGNVSGDVVAATCDSNGNCSSNGWRTWFYPDANAQDNTTLVYGVGNPFSFVLAALVGATGGETVNPLADPNVVQAEHGGLCFVLFCRIEVMDVTYASVNGSITNITYITSNTSVANAIQVVYGFGDEPTNKLQEDAELATYTSSAQGLANQFAIGVSQTGLGLASGAFIQGAAEEAQIRNDILVTRVLKGPFWGLVISNWLFAITGIVLTVVAFVAGRGEAREYQGRLSTAVLVANIFGGNRARKRVKEVGDMFEENKGGAGSRVALRRNQAGGYEYETVSQVGGGEMRKATNGPVQKRGIYR